MRDEVELKPDWETTLLRQGIYLAVLNLPFMGLYKAAFSGELEPGYTGVVIAGVGCLCLSLVFCYLFGRIRFGWNEEHVFKQGLFRRTEIGWKEIRKIYETGEAQGWTESDITFIKPKVIGKRLFVIEGTGDRIVLDNYSQVIDLKKEIVRRLNLKIEDQYNFAYDWIVNG